MPSGSYPRRWPCVDCQRPYTALRDNSRCTSCSRRRASERGAARARESRQRRAAALSTPTVRPIVPVPPPPPSGDLDVLCYRAHKERADLERQSNEQLADARRLFLVLEASTAPKRGRPRQDFRREVAA